MYRVVVSDPKLDRVGEDGAQRVETAGGCTPAAFDHRLAPLPGLDRGFGRAGSDLILELLDVAPSSARDLPRAKQRNDMAVDMPRFYRQRAGRLKPAPPRRHSLNRLSVEFAQVFQRSGPLFRQDALGRVAAVGDLAEQPLRLLAGGIHGQGRPELAQGQPALAAGNAVFEAKALCAPFPAPNAQTLDGSLAAAVPERLAGLHGVNPALREGPVSSHRFGPRKW